MPPQVIYPAPVDSNTPIRAAFVSANLFGHACAEALLRLGFSLSGIFTLPPEAMGNVSDRADFKKLSTQHQIPLFTIRHINDATSKSQLAALNLDLLFIIGWSQLIDSEVMSLAKWMTIGAHPALLPRNRGRAAIPWHFINGETSGGLSFFKIEEACDNGAILAQEEFPLILVDSATTYYQKITQLAPAMLSGIVHQIQQRSLTGTIQDESQATYLSKRSPKDGEIIWSKTATELYDLIRGTSQPYPGAYTFWKGKKVILWQSEPPAKAQVSSVEPGLLLHASSEAVDILTGDGFFLRITSWEIDPPEALRWSAGDLLGTRTNLTGVKL